VIRIERMVLYIRAYVCCRLGRNELYIRWELSEELGYTYEHFLRRQFTSWRKCDGASCFGDDYCMYVGSQSHEVGMLMIQDCRVGV
jgi:hypothetical protein